MHLILPTSYRSQSSCTEFARQIGLPWPACPCATREVGGGVCESPLSPEKAWSQEKVASSGLYREWEKCLIIDIERGESREGRGGESSAGVDWVLSQALPGRAGQGVGPESLVAEYTGRRTNFLGKVGPESWSSEIGPPMPAERSEPTVL
jgi:hypothetical protein